jgi:DNA polymerase III subunit beta
MKYTLERKNFFEPLQTVIGAINRKNTFPILGNVLITVQAEQLSLLATDLEVELIGRCALTQPSVPGQITVPAKKLYDICRTLPEDSILQCVLDEQRFIIKAAKSRFVLQTLPALDFPNFSDAAGQNSFRIAQGDLRYLLEQTHFAIAQQDVRYYLNGLLLELKDQQIHAVATDGHRMALCSMALNQQLDFHQMIIPRRAVAELLRLLQDNTEEVEVIFAQHHVRVVAKKFSLTSKLIDGHYPDYNQVLPKLSNRLVRLDRDLLKQGLHRVTILSSEKFRGVSLTWKENILLLQSHNAEHEEAEERMEIDYLHPEVVLGFNADYLLDVLNCTANGDVEITLAEQEQESGVLIRSCVSARGATSIFLVMPALL